MINFICADAGSSVGSIVIYVVLILVLIAMLVMPYFTQKKRNQEFNKMIESMKVGDLVKTAGGIIGRITKITDKGDIKTVILETGSKTEKSYMEFDMSMIYCVLKSTKTAEKVEDDNDNSVEIETNAESKDEVSEEPAEVKSAENSKTAEVKEEKKTAKKTTRKTSVKKSSK